MLSSRDQTLPRRASALAESEASPLGPIASEGSSLDDELLPLRQVVDLLPRRRQGRKVAVATAHRWASTGCRGVVLWTTAVGCCRCTTRRALREFFAAVAAAGQDAQSRTPAARSRSAEQASRECARLGL